MKAHVFDLGEDCISWIDEEKGPCVFIDDFFYLPKEEWSGETKTKALLVVMEREEPELLVENVTTWLNRDYGEWLSKSGFQLIHEFEKDGEKFIVYKPEITKC